jgi:hypothetical protein
MMAEPPPFGRSPVPRYASQLECGLPDKRDKVDQGLLELLGGNREEKVVGAEEHDPSGERSGVRGGAFRGDQLIDGCSRNAMICPWHRDESGIGECSVLGACHWLPGVLLGKLPSRVNGQALGQVSFRYQIAEDLLWK